MSMSFVAGRVVILAKIGTDFECFLERDAQGLRNGSSPIYPLLPGNVEHAPHIADRPARRHRTEGDDLSRGLGRISPSHELITR